MTDVFKTCTFCEAKWATRDAFLADPEVSIIGYQVDFQDANEGLFLFNHSTPACRTTMGIKVKEFLDLYAGPTYSKDAWGTDICEGRCVVVHDLVMCKAPCKRVHIRAIIQIIAARRSG